MSLKVFIFIRERLDVALYQSQLWKSLSVLAFLKLYNKDCQCEIFDTVSVNVSVKTLLPFKFKCNFEIFRWHTVVLFPWLIMSVFFSRRKFSNADLLRTPFDGTHHFVFLDLKVKPDKCLISTSELSPRCPWVSLMVDRLCQCG